MKVHFASFHPHKKMIEVAGIFYVLDTFYKLRKLSPEKAFEHIKLLNSKKHSIIDSGLFTLMFGADAGIKLDEKFINDWQNEYANFINKNNFKHSVVECDVQKKISPEFAWEMRRKFKTQIKNTIINVYHLEDGNPDKLIDYADYVAISVPELRINCSKKERYRITEYIATKAIRKNKKVHLLGCTEVEMLKKFSFCTSCDSTSWLSGQIYDNHRTQSSQTEFNNKKFSKNMFGNFTKSQIIKYYQIITKLDDYKKFAGDQS